MNGFQYVISLGAKCHTAAFLKRNNLKKASYPFDWIFSDLDMVPFSNYSSAAHSDGICPFINGAIIKKSGVYKVSYCLTLTQDVTGSFNNVNNPGGTPTPNFQVSVNGYLVPNSLTVCPLHFLVFSLFGGANIVSTGNIEQLYGVVVVITLFSPKGVDWIVSVLDL